MNPALADQASPRRQEDFANRPHSPQSTMVGLSDSIRVSSEGPYTGLVAVVGAGTGFHLIK
jgi:hypothetical protein